MLPSCATAILNAFHAWNEHTLADFVARKNLRLNDTVTQSDDDQSGSIAQSNGLIQIAQKNDWTPNLQLNLVVGHAAGLEHDEKLDRIQSFPCHSIDNNSS